MSGRLLTLTVNGKTVQAEEGATLLETARAAGFDIPTLCHHDELAGFGACRLCVVEIVQRGRSKVVASCLYPVEEGLEVLTESERIVKRRRIILEMMQARWPGISKELCERYGVKTGRMKEGTHFCIMCGLCVRHCSERKQANVLGFVGRGTERQVVSYSVLAKVHCPECGDGQMECLNVCPTGVIVNDHAIPSHATRSDNAFANPVRMRCNDNSKKVRTSVGDT
jgi:NADH dehydrogenase/NADH:ubiquinone oxidoreductase subunit G